MRAREKQRVVARLTLRTASAPRFTRGKKAAPTPEEYKARLQGRCVDFTLGERTPQEPSQE
jgi:hypothetical protein